MIPSIDRLQERNWVGICHIDVVDVRDVESIADEVDGNVASITLKSGKTWSRIYLEDLGGTFRDRWVLEGGDQVSIAELSGAIAKDRLSLMPILWRLKHGRYLVMVYNRNGDRLLMGNMKAPCRMLVLARKSGDGDNATSDRNEYNLAVNLKRRLPVPYYGGTPPTPGTNTCPTLADQIALVTAATILGLLDGTQASDLLVLLLEGASNEAIIEALSDAQITAIATDAGWYATLCDAIDDAIAAAPGSGDMTISGSGTDAIHGAYTSAGTANGKPYLVMGEVEVMWDGNSWDITGPDGTYFTSSEDVDNPWDVEEWTAGGAGTGPAPTITEGGTPIDMSALLDCLNEDQLDALIAALGGAGGGSVQVRFEQPDGNFVDGPLVAAPGPYQAPAISIKSTDGSTELYKLPADETDVVLPAMKLYGLSADGLDTIAIGRDVVAGDSSNLRNWDEVTPDDENLLPRFSVRTTDGETPIAHGDIASPDVLLAGVLIRYKDRDNVDAQAGAFDAKELAGFVTPDVVIPRRELKNANGTGLGQYIDAGMLIGDSLPNTNIPLKFVWQAGDADTYLWTVTDDEAGSYGTYTPSGTNGTLTYSKNGGGYTALSGAITLAVGDTITVRRTTTTNAGSVKWQA